MRRSRNVVALLCLACCLFALHGLAWACASCGCGDPTLSALGLEKPFKNRVRLALEQSGFDHVIGAADDLQSREEAVVLRTSLSVSYSPASLLTLSALVPLLAVWNRAADGPFRRTVGLGDAEFLVRLILYRDRRFSPSHLLGGLLGVKTPTGPRMNDDTGYPAPEDDQPGSGSFDPFAGLSYLYYGERILLFSSASFRWTTVGRLGYRRGSSFGATLGLQRQVHSRLAAALSADLRWTDEDTFGERIVPNTGGTLLSLTPALLLAPAQDLVVRLSLSLPVVQAFYGAQQERPSGSLSLVLDL